MSELYLATWVMKVAADPAAQLVLLYIVARTIAGVVKAAVAQERHRAVLRALGGVK